MGVAKYIDLNPRHLELVNKILARNVLGYEVRAFGSRVNWTARSTSDLDLAIVGEEALPQQVIVSLRADFEDSSLPIRLDVHDWHSIPENFRHEIDRGYVLIRAIPY